MRARGMTLIEVSIALAIAGLMVAVAIPAIGNVTRADLRQKAGQLAGAVRSMYGATALAGKSCRLVFDLDAGTYQAECAKGAVRLSREGERSRNGVRELSKEEELLADSKGKESLSEEDKTRLELLQKSAFQASSAVPVTQLGKTVQFDGIWIQHQPERYVAGKAFLYFWPSGLTESASIQLEQGEDVISLIVSPLTGRVQVISGREDAPGQKQ
jgi:general secretion pathway protein H